MICRSSLRDLTNAALKKYELVDSSCTVLAILYGSPDETASASALSEACQEKAANLTRVSDELVARGLVERGPKPGDRRAVMISLSARGRALIEQVLPEITAMVDAAYAGFTPVELGRLAALKARVIGKLGRLAP